MTSIDIEFLPATFVDAVLLCRKVGFRYLWIDVLCIIQDDGSNWGYRGKQDERSLLHVQFDLSSYNCFWSKCGVPEWS